MTEKVTQKFFVHYAPHFFDSSPGVNFIPGIEHTGRPASTLPGPEIKPTQSDDDHEHNEKSKIVENTQENLKLQKFRKLGLPPKKRYV